MGDWLLPWQARGRSGAVNDNFLWRNGRVYIMDNHRLALWCWWQHLAESSRWSYHHIDRHYDALWQSFNPWPRHTTVAHRTDLTAFRAARIPPENGKDDWELYRWDTITSALMSLHSDQIHEVTLATANEGDRPALVEISSDVAPWDLPGHLRYLAERDGSHFLSRIIDIDIDYFTHQDLDGAFGPVFSDAFISEIGESLRRGLENGAFGVVTVALSPSTTGSWQLAETIVAQLLRPLGLAEEFAAGAP